MSDQNADVDGPRLGVETALPAPPALSRVTAVILAGGLGTRLRSVVPDRQKVIADVSGRPFVTYLFDQLEAACVRTAVLCTGYAADRVRETFGAAYGPLSLRYSVERSPLGTGGALRLALPYLSSEWVLVMNGDSFCAVDLREFWRWHRSRGAAASLVLIEQPDARAFGRVRLGEDNRITGFEEKSEAPGAAWVSAGIYLVQRSLIESIPPDLPVSLEREVFPRWINEGLFGYRASGPFIDIGTPDSYARAQAFMQGVAR